MQKILVPMNRFFKFYNDLSIYPIRNQDYIVYIKKNTKSNILKDRDPEMDCAIKLKLNFLLQRQMYFAYIQIISKQLPKLLTSG